MGVATFSVIFQWSNKQSAAIFCSVFSLASLMNTSFITELAEISARLLSQKSQIGTNFFVNMDACQRKFFIGMARAQVLAYLKW